MGRLLVAEFRKTLTTKSWWGLMIPAVVLAFGFALGWGAFANEVGDVLSSSETQIIAQALGIETGHLPMGLLAIGHGINIGLTFPVIFGVFALAGEYSKKTITTTFLTAPNRVSVLTAKMITYSVWGAVYGLVVAAAASLGIALTVDGSRLPTGGQWLAVVGASVLAGVLATLFGIGVGAVWNSVVGSVVTLVIYLLVIENVLVLIFYGLWRVDWLGGVLPNGTMNGIVGAIGAQAFGAAGVKVPGLDAEAQWTLQYVAGAPGAFSWWASALVFFAWTMVFFAGGWVANQRRDIT
ncbi:ABC transporter permease [Amycolatopsis acidiphila]|uniref:ABC transporter permease subunit n=1 Tax=Amycolatopsis acidiphila TaxID=715473 RepID=A0A558A1P7_9PSEU|nr:ABC transporter permease subunit [Amycolatopsis acidiphila]TVT18183.1 ABC transporter permease subunit [Amycolatopsis acidiphila]UIJ58866.1 ABC transporter permease [Amycolatopsis acidiphila]GHG72443.1 ABC transporter permease [Amycolatopsis acidiphila]